MAKTYQLRILEQGADAWNQWRHEHPDIIPDLSRAYLSCADLKSFNLSHTDLSYAFLNQAVLDDSDLSHCNLQHAQLKHASLKRTRLDHSTLNHALLHQACLYRASLREASLKQTHLKFTDLTEVDATSASLHLAVLDHAKLNLADFNNASLFHANIYASEIVGASFDGADLSHASISHLTLEDTSFHLARLVEARLEKVRLIRANLEGVELSDTIFRHIDFSKALGLSDCVHRGPSALDTASLELSDNLPEHFLRGVHLEEERILEYLYGIALRVSFSSTSWISLIPFSAILPTTVSGKFLVEGKEQSVLIRLRSSAQVTGTLDVLLPIIAALDAVHPGAIVEVAAKREKRDTVSLAGPALQYFIDTLTERFEGIAFTDEQSPPRHPPVDEGLENPDSSDSETDASLFDDWFLSRTSTGSEEMHPRSPCIYDHFSHIFSRYNSLLGINEIPSDSLPVTEDQAI